MSLNLVSDRFEVLRDNTKCIQCQVCVKQCSNEVHIFDKEDNIVCRKIQNVYVATDVLQCARQKQLK